MVVLTVLTCSQGYYTKLCTGSPEELHPTTRENVGLNGTGLRLFSKDREAT